MLGHLISEKLSNDDELFQLGKNGRKYIFENYSLDKIVKQLEKIYKNFINGDK